MRVVFFTNNYLPRLSGVAISASSLKKGLNQLGVEVLVFAPRYHSVFKKELEKDIVRIRSFRYRKELFSLPLPFMHVSKIKRALYHFQPDIVHIHQPFLLGPYGLKLAHQNNLPAVFTYHTINEVYVSFIPFTRTLCKRISDHNEKHCAAYCNVIIAPTLGVKDYLRGKGIKTPCQVIPTGVDLDLFSFGQIDAARLTKLRQQNKIKIGQPILLHVGRLTTEKNIQFILDGFSQVLKRVRSAILLMIGSGVQSSLFIKEAKEMGLAGSIRWLGRQNRELVADYYALADLFLFSSQSDTQALVIYEALATGLPVIALDSIACRAIVQDKINGSIVRKKDPSEFADRIITFLDFKKEMKWSLPQDYSYQTMAARTLDLYNQLQRKK